MSNRLLLEFANHVRALRTQQSLTQERVADLSGLHLTYIAGIESGRRNPTLISIVALAAGLGVPPSALLSTIEGQSK